MAKLNVVIPAVEVTVDGVAYRKVDRKAQAGDIIRFDSETDVEEITSGGFYAVNRIDSFGDARITDDYGDDDYDTAGEDFEVYAPISEPVAQPLTETITFEGATWRKVDRDVREGDAIKFTDDDRRSYLTGAELYVVDRVDSCDDPQITDDDGDDYDAGSEDYEVYEKVAVEYREVKRKANVGERIKIVAAEQAGGLYGNGEEHVVSDEDRWNNGNAITLRGINHAIYHREYVVLEPVTTSAELAKPAEPERLKVGDYARYVRDGNNAMVTGDIVEITEVDQSAVPYRVKRLTDGYVAWAPANKLIRATDEEVASVKDPRSQFAIGDYVKVALAYCEHKVGDVLKITNTASGHDFRVDRIGVTSGFTYGYIDADKLVKLAAAEIAEIERKQAEEAAKRAEEEARRREETKWNAIGRKVNEYKRGDIVEVTLNAGRVRVGDIGEVGEIDGNQLRVNTHEHKLVNWALDYNVKLLVPVEQRFDRSADVVAEEVDAA